MALCHHRNDLCLHPSNVHELLSGCHFQPKPKKIVSYVVLTLEDVYSLFNCGSL